MSNLIKSWNDRNIRIRSDRYVSLTDMAQASGKQFSGWNRLESTKSYLATLSRSMQISIDVLVQAKTTGLNEDRGTWGHPKVAIRFAQWCSDEFAVQVDIWTDELMTTGKVELAPQQQPTAPSLPQDYEEAVAALLGQIREKKVLAAANQQLLQEKQVLQLAIAKTAPKVELFNVYVSSDGWLTGEQIAKQFSVSTRKMFDLLRAEKVIFQRSGRNIPCARWVEEKWATMRPVKCHDSVVRSSLVFSHKAIEQIFDLLRFNGLIPVNSDYQTHLDFDDPKSMKRADLVAV
jgi:phage antirepressor YoqD-like protein